MRGSLIYPPQTGVHKTMRKDGRERERKRGLDPNQFRPTDLPRGFQVDRLRLSLPCRMLIGLRACEHFGFRRLPTSTASQLQRASACRGFVLAYRCGAVPESHQVPFYSLRYSENQHGPQSIVASDICQQRYCGQGMILFHQRDVADEARKLPPRLA